MMNNTLKALVPAIFLASCASSSSDIQPTYVSPLTYRDYSCEQLTMEAERMSARAAEVAGVQDSRQTGDAVATTVGVVVFWPALFFIGGDGRAAAELARLKGEAEAIERASIQKECGIRFEAAGQETASP